MLAMSEPTLYQTLRDRLISGEFESGQRLKSETLRRDYDVSASTIREVLFRLSTVGLVDSLEQRGFRMPEQSAALRLDLTKTRIMLESEGACLSVRYGDVAWEARLTAAHHELKHIESRLRADEESQTLLKLWANAELKFHQTLIDECQSELIKEFHLQVFYRFRQQYVTTDREFGYIPENVAQHQGILDAVLNRDESLVRARILEHLSRNLQRDNQ